MSQGLKRKHEGWQLLEPSARRAMRAVGLQPRSAVPGGAPGGFRPIPTSRKTKGHERHDRVLARPWPTRKLGRTSQFFKEATSCSRSGSPALRSKGQNVKVTSMQLLNKDLADAGPMDEAEAKAFFARDNTLVAPTAW